MPSPRERERVVKKCFLRVPVMGAMGIVGGEMVVVEERGESGRERAKSLSRFNKAK